MNDTIKRIMARVHAIQNLALLAANPINHESEQYDYISELVGARQSLESDLVKLITVQPAPIHERCKGCNGQGLVGNILDTDTCPFCNGNGIEQTALGQEPSDAQIALLDPWMRPAAAKELLTQVFALSPKTPHGGVIDASEEDDFLTALAQCRDAMPKPRIGTSLMYDHDAAICCPIEVSSYVRVSIAVMQERDRNQQAVIDKLRKTLSDIDSNEPKSWVADEALKSLDETAKQIEKSPFETS